jgi:YegS/Rv2252/BmrU family lipid kinase
MTDTRDSRRVHVIFNPASGRGRGAKRMDAYRSLLGERFSRVTFHATQRAGDEYRLADRALESGCDVLVAVGGDGTWSHVADRLLSAEGTDAVLGVLPAGTGNDFGRNLGLRYGDPADAVGRLATGKPVAADAGRIVTPSGPAEARTRGADTVRPRHFINVVGTGFDVAVVDAAAGARFLKGEVLYKVTALQQLFRFPGLDLQMQLDGGAATRKRHLMLTVTNGAWFGGGFPIAPDARIDDGKLHACVISDAAPLRRMTLFNRAEKGRHVTEPEVEMLDARRVQLRGPDPFRFEADGDVFETEGDELELEILPGALRVLQG